MARGYTLSRDRDDAVTLSISLVVYEYVEKELDVCVQSLARSLQFCTEQNLCIDWQLHIIDNGNNPELKKYLGSQIALTINTKNEGFGKAHNIAISGSTAEFHLIINPDVVFQIDSLFELVSLMRTNNNLILSGPKGLSKLGDNARLCKRYPTLWVLFLRGFAPKSLKNRFQDQLKRYEYHDLPEGRPSFGVNLLSGCCMLAKTEPIKALGGFDPKYFLYFEDYDLCIRASQIGEIAYNPRALITHSGDNTSNKA